MFVIIDTLFLRGEVYTEMITHDATIYRTVLVGFLLEMTGSPELRCTSHKLYDLEMKNWFVVLVLWKCSFPFLNFLKNPRFFFYGSAPPTGSRRAIWTGFWPAFLNSGTPVVEGEAQKMVRPQNTFPDQFFFGHLQRKPNVRGSPTKSEKGKQHWLYYVLKKNVCPKQRPKKQINSDWIDFVL